MTIHREGYRTIVLTIVLVGIIDFLTWYFLSDLMLIKAFIYTLSLVFLLIILQFFRSPQRNIAINDENIIAPADGKIVVIEEAEENEYFNDKRIQVSIFMSPLNVHINRNPISGVVKYLRYHKGLYLVAWHPKSSTENERTTLVVENKNKKTILFRQIAGALAKRIVYYPKEGETVTQGNEFGFIKFGSRVDLFLPVDAKIKVQLNEKVIGGITTIASF